MPVGPTLTILYHHRTASRDGQDVHITELIHAMREQGHTVVVVEPHSISAAQFGHDGGWVAVLKRLVPKAAYEVMELAYSLPAYLRLKRAYDRHHPDLLYERYNLNYLAGLWLKRRTGIRYVVEVNAPLSHERKIHDGLALPGLAAWSEQAVWRGADLTLPVTDVLAGFLRRAGVAEERIRVVPNGVNRHRFPPETTGESVRRALGLEGKVVLGFTGFIRDWHGLPSALDAMAAMGRAARGLHLLVIGDGPARADLERHAAELGLADSVTCLGLVERDAVASYVAAFDIALQPNVVDYASPLKLFEYMALGRAIIAPDQPNIREILTDGDNALLFRPSDIAHFRTQIMRLCGDADLRHRLGAAAARTIDTSGLTWSDNVHRVLDGPTTARANPARSEIAAG